MEISTLPVKPATPPPSPGPEDGPRGHAPSSALKDRCVPTPSPATPQRTLPGFPRTHVRDLIPAFPHRGINYYRTVDIWLDVALATALLDDMAEAAAGMRPEVLMAVGSRGFLFATAVAQRLGLPVVCAQPAGKLPGPVHREGYSMVYDRAKAMELPSDLGHLVAGKNAVVVDDAVATGGSLLAAKRLLEGAGMRCTGCLVPFEDGRHGKLEEYLEELAPLTVTWFDLL